MFARLLVPTDFSAPSDAALEHARTFARSFGGALHLLHVTGDAGTPPHVPGNPRDCEPAALRQLRDRLTEADRRRRLTVRVMEGSDPAQKIVGYARSLPADLIIMGTHGRSGVAHLLLGSVAEKVVRTAPCPVLTARAAPAAGGFTRILVPTDFSGPSDAALDCARLLALRFSASIHLLHVLEDPRMEGPFGSEVFVSESADARAARFKEARERLSHRVSAYDRDRRHMTTEVILGAPARTIVDYAGDNTFDLIVMGTHGRTGLAHLLTGSVAERVVRHAACPVITTHDGRPCVEVAVPVETNVGVPA
jgi:nucleotide-binding universal stress UspA family protein